MEDIHNKIDERNIKIDYIGVDEVKIPISFRSNAIYNSIANINAGVSLNEREKGAHLSRIVETLNEVLTEKELTIKDLNDVLNVLSDKIKANNVLVNIKFPIMITSTSPISKKLSYIDVLLELKAQKTEKQILKGLEVSIYGAMCCPSSKTISQYGAHSQRCLLKISINGEIDSIKVEEIVEIMEKSFSAPVSSIVKRVDEKFLTEKAYENPKFSEDLIRDVLIELGKKYNNVEIEAESTNYESIHSHNVRARGRIRK